MKCTACNADLDPTAIFIRCERASRGECPEVKPGTRDVATELLIGNMSDPDRAELRRLRTTPNQ